MTNSKLSNVIFGAAVVILLLAFVAQHQTTDKYWLVLLDNVHWTAANFFAAVMAGLGYFDSTGAERAARRWFFAGLVAYAIGQVLWDIQVAIGWNPFPAPSDLFYLMLGPACLSGLLAAVRILLPKSNQQVIALDTALLSVAILTLTLAVYLSNSSEIDLLTLGVMSAYPVFLLTAASFSLLLIMHFRPQPDWSWILLQVGLGLQGVIWMWWNVQALSGTTVDGSFFNEFFSVASIVVGFSAMKWRVAPSASVRYEKWCEGMLRMLPILAVVVAALAAVLVLSLSNIHTVIQESVLFGAIIVVVLSALRQSLTLREHEKLLAAEQAMAESNHLFEVVINTVPVGIFWKDRNLRYLGGNAVFARDAGITNLAEIPGKTDYDLHWQEYAGAYRDDDSAVMNSGEGKLAFDEAVRVAGGGKSWVRTSKVPLRDAGNEVIGILGIYYDITEQKKIEEEQRIAAVTFDTQEAILITDPEGIILRVNQAFQQITGYSAAEVIGQNPRIFQSGRHDTAFYQAMWSALLDTGKWSGEMWDKRKDGGIYPKMMTITAVYDDSRQLTHYVAVFRDISLSKKSEQEIHQLAFYDSLTRLPNRRLLLDRLHQALAVSARNARHGALLFLDLDHFKTVNDTQGHAMGDRLLIEAARRLQDCVREGDSVARLGGDEFVVLLEELSSEAKSAATQTELIAEKMLIELGKPYMLEDFECHSTVSIGISLFFGRHENAEELLKHADVAMYQAKTAGRNTIRFFDPEMQKALDHRASVESDLRHALVKHQFLLYYQVQVDQSLRPIGAEALLRWKHPVRGLVSPMQFIPLAEETGLIVPVGLWVLRAACAQLKAWQNDVLTRDLTLAVNVSAKQFRQADFVVLLRQVLLESDAQPSLLKLELTESTVLENVEDTISKMRQINALGVGFSMDDFGTGYSSLQYLKRLPLDQIKIDQSFVRDITTDPNDAAIVKTIIAMTEALGLSVIAEGVETREQCDFLEMCGCHSYQGYLFGKPVPVEEFERLLQRT